MVDQVATRLQHQIWKVLNLDAMENQDISERFSRDGLCGELYKTLLKDLGCKREKGVVMEASVSLVKESLLSRGS